MDFPGSLSGSPSWSQPDVAGRVGDSLPLPQIRAGPQNHLLTGVLIP